MTQMAISWKFGEKIEAKIEADGNLYRMYRSLAWKDVHPISQRADSERIVLGKTTRGWLRTPGQQHLAELLSLVEEHGDAGDVETMAAVLQRAAAFDPMLMGAVECLASNALLISDLGEASCEYALTVQEEVYALLTYPERADALLPELECRPSDVLSALRQKIVDREGSLTETLQVMAQARRFYLKNEVDVSLDVFVEATLDLAAIFRFFHGSETVPRAEVEAIDAWLKALWSDMKSVPVSGFPGGVEGD